MIDRRCGKKKCDDCLKDYKPHRCNMERFSKVMDRSFSLIVIYGADVDSSYFNDVYSKGRLERDIFYILNEGLHYV